MESDDYSTKRRIARAQNIAANLHGTTDAQIWAREWIRVAREITLYKGPEALLDEGWMIGWFANAIETGRSAGLAIPKVSRCKHCNEVIHLCKFGDLHWEPDYDPSDDVVIWRHMNGYASCIGLQFGAEPKEVQR